VRGVVRSRVGSWICAWLVALFALASHAQTPPGTLIANTAQGVFTPPGGVPTLVLSNTDSITTGTLRTPSSLQILHYAPGAPGALAASVGPALCSSSGSGAGPFAPAPTPSDLSGAPINLAAPVDLLSGGAFHQGEALFVRVADPDQNANPLAVESVLLTLQSLTTGDVEVVQASETGPNTGEFVGYLMSAPPPPASGDCRLSVVAGETLTASYVDAADGSDSASQGALVDPLGLVFDSATGAPVDGATVTLIDAATGMPATVFGDDGVSSFPASVVSGGSATDSGGTSYAFAPGRFRFPFVAPGSYRLQVTPPATHAFPSLAADAALQLLPGAPFALGPGSRGGDFVVPLGPIFRVDVPLDSAAASAGISLAKRASRASAGIGEFIQYVLSVSSPAGSAGNAALLEDRLPQGFRFERGSLRVGGAPAPDPLVTPDGRTLTIPLGVLSAGAQLELRYVARVGSGTPGGRAVNEALVRAGAIVSNQARAATIVAADLLTERATLVGRVMDGGCGGTALAERRGVAGVRVYLEDGTHVVTDEAGRFHFPLVHADTHVVQLDTATLPAGFLPAACGTNAFGGRSYSQFVEPQRGSLWRTDFFVERVTSARGLHQQLSVTPEGDHQKVELRVSVGGATLAGVAGLVLLPDGLSPLPGSLEVDGPGARLDTDGPAPTVRAPQLAPGESVTLRFAVDAEPSQQLNALARGRRGSGEAVQTPVVRSALDAKRVYSQSATWEESPPAPAKPPEEPPADAAFGEAWLAQASPANAWLYPDPEAIARIPSVKIGIQHDPALRVRLFRNGELVSPLNFEGLQKNRDKTVAVSRWRGVDLAEGPNTFLAELLDVSGAVAQRIQTRLHSSGPPVRAELMPTLSTLVADGHTAPVVAVRLYDRWDQPVREGMSGPLQVALPHRALESLQRARERKLAVPNLGASQFVVGRGGIARIELEPTSSVGRFALTLQLAEDGREEIEGWLSPGKRAFTLVALGTLERGFAASDTGSDDARRAAGISDDRQAQRLALFGAGTLFGEWQLTGAIDTEPQRRSAGDRVRRTLDAQEHFTLYGDDTEERYEAPSADGIYLRLQRDRFYALYGDAETALSETELARYERVVTGIKSEYYGERVRFNGFATDTGQSFARDELRGNGTSGLYRLSRAPIVVGSERVRIEVRDRFRPSRVLETRPLVSQIDYDVDPFAGTLHFREPVPSRDERLNPVLIVADYETASGGDAISGGGRLAARFFGGLLELGATGVHEGRGAQSGDLVGVDATLEWSEATQLRAEWAGSEGDDLTGARRGQGWLVSAEHRSEKLELAALAREQEAGFGLGQLSAIDQGARRIGVDGRWRLRDQWSLTGSAFHDENLLTRDDRQIAESLLEWEAQSAGAHVGARYVHDAAPLASASTGQLLLGGHYGFLDKRVNARLGSEVGFGSESPHGDYADRVAAGLDWRATDWLTLFAEHEVSFGDAHSGQDTRVGMAVTPWEGGQISASFGRSPEASGGPAGGGFAGEPTQAAPALGPAVPGGREYGPRSYANLGVAQHWNLAQHWGFDLSVDRSQTLSDSGAPPFDSDVPLVSGTTTDDYTAISLGAGYSQGDVAFTTRLETRIGELEDQWNFTLGALRERDRISYAGHVELLLSDRGGALPSQEDVYGARLALAYRPLDTRWIVLEQLEYEHGLTSGGGLDTQGDRVINHLKLNWTRDARTQVSLQYSAKWVGESFDGARYESLGHLFGVEARQDVAPGWDVALHARVRQLAYGHSGADDGSFSVGVSIGRLVVKNLWASAGYNVLGFQDEEFSRSEYTAKGPFVRLRLKVDQDSVREWLDWSPRLAGRLRNVFAARN
jgi:uncharacterized repeat protein (TIGR01451 family)